MFPAASGGQHQAEAPGMGAAWYKVLPDIGCCRVWDAHLCPGCTPRSQVAPSPRGPARSHIPWKFQFSSAQLGYGFSPGTGFHLVSG